MLVLLDLKSNKRYRVKLGELGMFREKKTRAMRDFSSLESFFNVELGEVILYGKSGVALVQLDRLVRELRE